MINMKLPVKFGGLTEEKWIIAKAYTASVKLMSGEPANDRQMF